MKILCAGECMAMTTKKISHFDLDLVPKNSLFSNLSTEANRVMFLSQSYYVDYLQKYTNVNKDVNLSILGIDFLQAMYEPDAWKNTIGQAIWVPLAKN